MQSPIVQFISSIALIAYSYVPHKFDWPKLESWQEAGIPDEHASVGKMREWRHRLLMFRHLQ